MNYADYVLVFKALADETRLKITEMLSKEGELCACSILENFKITQPTLSYHMKILCDSELITGRREGSWMKYSVNNEKLSTLKGFFCSLSITSNSQHNDSCCCCEK